MATGTRAAAVDVISRSDQHDGAVDRGHGVIHLVPIDNDHELKQGPVKNKASGVMAVLNSFYYGLTEAGPLRGTLPMLQINQTDGFDCPGCAWPDPDNERSALEFCENGAKAYAHESDKRRITAEFFRKHSVSELSRKSDFWLEQQGRLIEPMLLDEGATHYTPIRWEDAFERIADELNGLGSPDEASFYTSGKAVNEAAFVFQVFARALGTNNLPDCSNMCHEASGRALTKMFGMGKGTVKLDDFEKADLVFVVGQNPGTNHPRQLTALQKSKRNGAKIISVNPLPEAGLMNFMHPQQVSGILGIPTKLTDLFLQVKINGDIPLFKGIIKQLVEWDDERGGVLDHEFAAEFTEGMSELLAHVRETSWDAIVQSSGIAKDQIVQAATWASETSNIIICWCLGVAQHANGTQNVQELLNLLLVRGAIGKPGAGACCVRGHSNVQGDRTMGVWEMPPDSLLDSLKSAFGFEPPRHRGLDSQRTAKAMHEGKIKVFVSLGGNYLLALPDTQFAAEALQNTDLTVRIGTKLNRADLLTGKRSLILPCLGRTELDVRPAANGQPARPQFTSCENSMGVVQRSQGTYKPAADGLMHEVEILCRMAHAVLGDRAGIDWLAWADDYDRIRDGIAAVIPGCENYNERVKPAGGFYLPNGPRQRNFTTPSGKAVMTINPIPDNELAAGHFAMTTVRSHDQFNTTIYGLHDRYRGIYNVRQVVLMNEADIAEQGLKPEQKVDIESNYEGVTRKVCGFRVVAYPIPRQCAAMYYPEANPLIPMDITDEFSNCPSFKRTIIRVQPAGNR